MSMSTYITGHRPPDAKFIKMKAAFDACIEAQAKVPDEVWAFFNNDEPDENGVTVPIDEATEKHPAEDGVSYTVDLSKLPPDVTVIRFTNSW